MRYVTWGRWAFAAALALLLAAGCGKEKAPVVPPLGPSVVVTAGVTAADLQAEIKVPHLWVTVEGIWLEKGVVSIWLRVERAGGLEEVSVSQLNAQLFLAGDGAADQGGGAGRAGQPGDIRAH